MAGWATAGLLLTTACSAGMGQGTQTAPKAGVKAVAPTTAVPVTPTTAAPTTGPPTTVDPTTVTPATAAPTSATEQASGVFAQPSVTAYLAGRTGDITAAAYDYVTGELSVYRPGTTIATASVVKVHILETLLAQAQAAGRGLTSSEQRLAAQMIEQSDNDAATDLWDEVGGAAGLDRLGAQVGLADTAPDAAGYWGLSTTSATDQIALLRNLTDASTTLSPTSQAYALGLLAQVESDQAWGVSAGLAPGTSRWLKDGWLPESDGWYVNSVGIVEGSGRHYALVVLTAGSATQDDGEATIEGLSTLVWGLLAH